MNFPFDEQNLNSTSDCIFISCHFLAEVTLKYFPKFTRKYPVPTCLFKCYLR